jgi:hypothetical protein
VRGGKSLPIETIALSATIDTNKELKALKMYANTLLSYSKVDLNKAVKSGALIEVVNDG